MGRLAMFVGVVLMFAAAACAGDGDKERKRAEAAQWCEITLRLDEVFDDTDGSRAYSAVLPFDRAAEWVDVAPAEIRRNTEQAARILREAAHVPRPPALAGARKEIAAYAADYCAEPVPCIADVEGNPRLPCINRIEARRRR